ncbi:abortive infection system antitoxin AbiGi family protein [Acinetobacter brisouii]
MSEKSPYPSTIFHFTDEYCSLINILKLLHFKLSYAREHIDFGNETRNFSVPMVSFCDLRIRETLPHIEKYGNFGIGLSKEWAIKSRLNPVLYLTNNNEISENFMKDLQTIFNMFNGASGVDESCNGQSLSDVYHRYLNIIRFIKNYEGSLDRKGDTVFYRFADENEWRYVLPLEVDNPEILNVFIKPAIGSHKAKAEANASIKNYNLKFSWDDIKYLIVKQDSYRDSLIDYLNSINAVCLDFLKTRIITVDQIKNDF